MIALTLAALVALEPPPSWPVTLTVTEGKTLVLKACFPGNAAAGVRVATPRARRALLSATAEPGAIPLKPGPEGAWSLPHGAADCFTATYDAVALARPPMSLAGSFDPRDVLLSPIGAGLGERSARVSFATSAAAQLWVPWQRAAPNAFRAPDSAFRLPGNAFVRPHFSSRTLAMHGTTAHVSLADGFATLDLDGVLAWLSRALAVNAELFGDFPCSEWSLVVVPAPPGAAGRGSPVVFGSASRGGGPHVVAFVPGDVRAESLPGEWVLVHELFHLAQPWIGEGWFAEGLATYYGEVLRARAGVLSPAELWAALLDGFRRGASVGGELPLGREEDEMVARRTFWRVYWGGAALALLADVRFRSRGAGSLDDGVRALSARPELKDARAALAVIAEVTGDDGFTALATAALASKAFPEITRTLEALGVREGPGGVTLDDAAPLAAVRRAIETGARPE